jgi:hypothetical protein
VKRPEPPALRHEWMALPPSRENPLGDYLRVQVFCGDYSATATTPNEDLMPTLERLNAVAVALWRRVHDPDLHSRQTRRWRRRDTMKRLYGVGL